MKHANSNPRRIFLMQAAAGSAALTLGQTAFAQAVLDEKDPQAKALAYAADASKVDKAKNPKFASGQNCGNCALFQGKSADATGGCPLFGAKKVATKGWCNAYAKKA